MNEQTARQYLDDLEFDGSNLRCKDTSFYVRWDDSDTGITLDGWFEVEELEAIVWWIRNKRKVDEIK